METGSLQRSRSSSSTSASTAGYCDALSPRRAVSRQVENPHHDVSLASLLVHVLRVEREREVMDLLGMEVHAFAAGRHRAAPGAGRSAPVPVALIIDAELWVGLGVVPPRIAFDRNAGGTDHLIFGEVERHVVGRELAVA